MSDQNTLKKSDLIQALQTHFSQEESLYLAEILFALSDQDSICYHQIDIPEDWKDDVIMVACEERLILPMKSRRGSAWEDQILDFAENEIYHMPRIINFLTGEACQSGEWNPQEAILKSLTEAGEDQPGQTAHFLNRLISISPECKLDVSRMQAISAELGLQIDMHDSLDRFVRCGIMSACTQSSLRSSSPRYEINRSLYWKTG